MKKGFTLIELLAVIVILAIIALIATPTIIGLIDNARKNAFEVSAKNLVRASELEYGKNALQSNRTKKIAIFENGVSIGYSLNFKGETPENGMIVIEADGKIKLALHNGKYCITKDETGIYLTEEKDYSECMVPGVNLPEAVVTTSPAGDLYPTTNVIFESNTSIAKDGKSIVDSQWYNVFSNYAVGNHIIKLRVKDSDGFWSPWKEHTISIIPTPTIAKVAVGAYHTLVLLSDKTVMSFGSNNKGQLGNETIGGSTLRPTRISDLNNIKDIYVYKNWNFAITETNTVYAWGENTNGVLGIGNTTTTPTPTLISGLSNVKQITSSDSFTMAVLYDGSVRSWGLNTNSRLGIGGTTDQYSPVNVTAVSGINQAANGNAFAIVLKSDGTLRSWGYNGSGSLGNNSTIDSSTPVTPSGVTSALKIASSNGQAYSIIGGTVKAWGFNGNGQLGTNDTNMRTVPTIVSGLPTTVANVFANSNSTYAVLTDGTMYSWGMNGSNNLLGITTQGNILTPQLATMINNVDSVIVGGSYHIFIKKKDGKYYTWGNNSFGQLGNGNTTSQNSPIEFNIW